MFSEILQDVIVALVALAAGVTIVRRVLRFAEPAARRSGCANCGSSSGSPCAPAGKTEPAATTVQHVAVLIRHPTEGRSHSTG